MSCKVYDCRYANTHVTKGHRCGNCGEFGHGQVECSIVSLKQNLVVYYSNKIPEDEQCTIPGCRFKELHRTMGHFCGSCRKFGQNCTCGFSKVKCPMCRQETTTRSLEELKTYGISDQCSVCREKPICIRLKCGHACLCETCYDTLAENVNPVRPVRNDPELDDISLRRARVLLQSHENAFTLINAGMGCQFYVIKKEGNFSTFFIHADDWAYSPDRVTELRRQIDGLRQV